MLNNAGNIWKQFIKKVKGQFIKLVKIKSCKFTYLCRDEKTSSLYTLIFRTSLHSKTSVHMIMLSFDKMK